MSEERQPQRIRVTCTDGTFMTGSVTTEDGTPLIGVLRVKWELGRNEFAKAVIEFESVLADVVGEVQPDELDQGQKP